MNIPLKTSGGDNLYNIITRGAKKAINEILETAVIEELGKKITDFGYVKLCSAQPPGNQYNLELDIGLTLHHCDLKLTKSDGTGFSPEFVSGIMESGTKFTLGGYHPGDYKIRTVPFELEVYQYDTGCAFCLNIREGTDLNNLTDLLKDIMILKIDDIRLNGHYITGTSYSPKRIFEGKDLEKTLRKEIIKRFPESTGFFSEEVSVEDNINTLFKLGKQHEIEGFNQHYKAVVEIKGDLKNWPSKETRASLYQWVLDNNLEPVISSGNLNKNEDHVFVHDKQESDKQLSIQINSLKQEKLAGLQAIIEDNFDISFNKLSWQIMLKE